MTDVTVDISVVPQHYEESVPFDSVEAWPGNPRRHHDRSITDSLTANGFYGAILVQASSRRVLAGHGRINNSRKRGLTAAPMIFLDVDDATAERIVAIDNRANDLAGYDPVALRAFVARFKDNPLGTGYSDRDIAKLLVAAGRGSLLEITDVAMAEPVHQCERGQVWHIGRHTLVVEDVITGWKAWAPLLTGDALFIPYPGPYAPLSERAELRTVVMVQPDPYIAGHILDKYAAIKGADAISLVP